MSPFTVKDIIFDDDSHIKFISKPKNKKDTYSWRAYRKWYMWKDWKWVIITDAQFPYKRDKDINYGCNTN